jgi:hypothetical protein
MGIVLLQALEERAKLLRLLPAFTNVPNENLR